MSRSSGVVALAGYERDVLHRLRAMAEDELAGIEVAAVDEEAAVRWACLDLATERDRRWQSTRETLLAPDDRAQSALSAIQCLDWLLLSWRPTKQHETPPAAGLRETLETIAPLSDEPTISLPAIAS